jgi:TolB-like protein/DNA-binding winged helix-turn-helix (wHTH) protein/Tfp pilus assembly protein PilF
LRDGTVVPLTPKVLETLKTLVENAGRPVSKEELLRSVWPDTFVEESNLAQNISVVRKALGGAPGGGAYIETIAKRGYRFVAEVRPGPAMPPPESPEPETAAAVPNRRTVNRTAIAVAAVLLMIVAGGILYRHLRAAAGPGIRSVAVLPLKNLSGDAGQEYLADGITELLTTELSKALPLRVTSAASAMQLRGQPLTAIAQKLHVDALLEGSAVRAGDRLRVTVQLIQAASDRQLWAETYDRDMTDALLVEEEIAQAIAREIRVVAVPVRAAAVNRDAFEAYLRARYYISQRSDADVKKAVAWYEKAIEADPAYAAPHAGLADCYNQQGTVMIGNRSPAESHKLAMAAARRALEIDPDLAEAHAALAYANLYEWNWDAARDGLERAIHLNPNYPFAHLWLAHYHTARGNFDRAIQEARLACDLDPLSELMPTQAAWLLEKARRYDEATRGFRQVLADHPAYQWALWQLGSVQIAAGDYDSAIATLQKAVETGHRSSSALGTLGQAYAAAGRKREAQSLLDELSRRSRERYVPPHAFVHIYIGLGDKDKAFEWLEKSYLEHSNSLLWLGVTPLFDPVRSDPRFDNLLRRVGLR